MQKLQGNQRGFGAAEAVIIILVLIILGGAGWIVYTKTQSKSPAKTTTAESKKTSTAPTTTNEAKAKNLYVGDWQVSLRYDGEVTLTESAGPANTIFVSSQELTNANAACGADKGGVGGILRAKTDEVAHFSGHEANDVNLTGQQYVDKYPNEAGVLSGYAYTYFIRSNDTCASSSDAATTVQAIKTLFQ